MQVRPVQSSQDLKAFIDLPYRLHRDDPVWVPPFRQDVRTLLSKEKNPFFDHGDAVYFIAERDGRVAGRIAAITNRLHNETHADLVGFFGFFECENDQATADALLHEAAGWVAEKGLDTIRGPMSFSVNDECGVLIDGFDTPPYLMMPHNPLYYRDLIESAGFSKVKDLWAFLGGPKDTGIPVPERLARAVEVMGKRLGVRLRPLDMRRFPEEIQLIRRLFNDTWSSNWGYVPMTQRELAYLAKQFKPVVNPDIIPIAEIDGRPIGFGLAIPDLNEVLVRNRSGRLFPAALELLWKLKRRRITRVRVALLGVIPEYRGKGIDAMLYHWVWTRAVADGMPWAEASWILEDNPAMILGLEKMGFERYKTYRVYEKRLGGVGAGLVPAREGTRPFPTKSF
jgi:GNAT superfamily N-acetyltransferase